MRTPSDPRAFQHALSQRTVVTSLPSSPRSQRRPKLSAGVREDRALQRAFTVVELVVVLTIVAVTATIVIVAVGEVAATSRADATRIALANVRAAIVGDTRRPGGYLADMRVLPSRIADLFRRPASAAPFDVATRLGWRGPYLSPQHGFYEVDIEHGFTLHYGDERDPVPLDGWQKPIVLQVPDVDGDGLRSPEELRHARLVSAGDDGEIDTPRTGTDASAPGTALLPSRAQCDDDLVAYLHVADERPDG